MLLTKMGQLVDAIEDKNRFVTLYWRVTPLQFTMKVLTEFALSTNISFIY